MVRETGVDGVVVGRGCQCGRGFSATCRPRSRAATSATSPTCARWRKASTCARLMVETTLVRRGQGAAGDPQARGLVLQGLRGGRGTAHQACPGDQPEVLRETLAELDQVAYPGVDAEGPRGRAGSPAGAAQGWLLPRSTTHSRDIAAAELDVSGGWNPADHRSRRPARLRRPRFRPLGGGTAQDHVPLRLRARPRPGAALVGAAASWAKTQVVAPDTDDFVGPA